MVSSFEEERQRQNVLKRLKFAACLCCCFMVVEVIGGYLAGSLAIMSDAAHLFADLASFAVASKYIYKDVLVDLKVLSTLFLTLSLFSHGQLPCQSPGDTTTYLWFETDRVARGALQHDQFSPRQYLVGL